MMPGLIRLVFLGLTLWASIAKAEQADPLSSLSWIHKQITNQSETIVSLNHDVQVGAFGAVSLRHSNPEISGTISLTGPAQRLSSLHQSGSWRIVGCSDKDSKPQTVLAYCTNKDHPSQCTNIFLGGAEHTIVMLPDDCGASPFARVVSFKHSNKALPKSEQQKLGKRKVAVFELKFDYDFKKIPAQKDETPTNLHMEFSNLVGYTTTPDYGKPRSYSQWLWGIGHIQGQNEHIVNLDHSFSEALANMEQKCDGFSMDLAIKVHGHITGKVKFGYYFSGTIIPPQLDQHYAYLSSNAKTQMDISLTGTAQYTFKEFTLPVIPAVSLPFLSYPGILQVGPYFEVLAGLKGDVAIDGTITAKTGFTIPAIDISLGNGSSPRTSSKGVNFATVELSKDLQVSAGVTLFLAPQVGIQVNVLSGLVDADVGLRPSAGVTAGGHVGVDISSKNNHARISNPCVEVDGSVDLYWLAHGNIGTWGKSIQGRIWGISKKLWGKCWKIPSKKSKNSKNSKKHKRDLHSEWRNDFNPFSLSASTHTSSLSAMNCPSVPPFGSD